MTYHNLPVFRKSELERLLECLNDHAHPLGRQVEPTRASCVKLRGSFGAEWDSQSLVFAEVVRHGPVIERDRMRVDGGESRSERTSWLRAGDLHRPRCAW